MKRISDAKYAQVQAYPGNAALNSNALGAAGVEACGYTKSAYIVDRYNSPSAVNPDVDPNIVGASGIFSTAEYQASSDYQKTAAVMKLVIDGNAAAGTIEMGGFDYHSGNRMDGEAKDLNLGNCTGHDLCIQRRLARQQRHDRQLRGRARQGRLDGRQPKRRGNLFPGFQSQGKGGVRAEQSGNELAARQFQSRRVAEYHRQPRRQQRAQLGTDGGAQLHGAAQRQRDIPVADFVACSELEQHPRQRNRAGTPDCLATARRPREWNGWLGIELQHKGPTRVGPCLTSRCQPQVCLIPETHYTSIDGL
jgi:hypothetical protein